MTYAKNPKKKWYCYNDSSCKVGHSHVFTLGVLVRMGDLSRWILSPEKKNKAFYAVIWHFLTQVQVHLGPLWPMWTCLH